MGQQHIYNYDKHCYLPISYLYHLDQPKTHLHYLVDKLEGYYTTLYLVLPFELLQSVNRLTHSIRYINFSIHQLRGGCLGH